VLVRAPFFAALRLLDGAFLRTDFFFAMAFLLSA
jgi:hypothetical protein